MDLGFEWRQRGEALNMEVPEMGWRTRTDSERDGASFCPTLEFFIRAQAVATLLFGGGFGV